MTTDGAKGLIGSLLHGLEILDMFERDRSEIGIGEMAQHLGLHRSTTSRLAATLAVAGYLEPTGEPGRYRLSGKLVTLGELVASEGDVRRAALPYLRDLVQGLGETGHLAILEGAEAVTVGVVDGWQTVRMHSWVGKRSPAHCSSMGKALLASLDAGEIDARYPDARLEARTGRTITDRDELSAISPRCARAGTRWTAKNSSRTCAAWPGRCSTGPGRWWRASACRGRTRGSTTRASPPSPSPCAAPLGRSAPGSAPPAQYRAGAPPGSRRQPACRRAAGGRGAGGLVAAGVDSIEHGFGLDKPAAKRQCAAPSWAPCT